MEKQLDQDTISKVDLINKKIDEINQRRMGCHTTRVEDDLDRQELDEYIRSLMLSDDQKRVIDRINRNNSGYVIKKSSLYFFFILLNVMLQFYLAYHIYETLMKDSQDIMHFAYLFALVLIFVFISVQTLKYIRVWR